MTKIFLYAEVLTHIRQVTLYASLETAETAEETVLHLVSDKKRVTVREGDVTSGIYLPTEISGTADVTIDAGKKKEISVRLEIGDTSELLPRHDVATAIEVPWSAQDLAERATLHCKSCQATIVPGEKVSSWKDLPSENWAEMMDFWHCHKPHTSHSHTNRDAAQAKGYSSTSQLAISPGTGLVDTVSFLLHKSDCTGLKAPKLDATKSTPILKCKHCSTVLGERDNSLPAIKLFKSRLAIRQRPLADLEAFPPSIFINAQLLLSIESLATRKFILHSAVANTPGLHLWIFNPDIHYSSSKSGPVAHRATKIFYQATLEPQQLLDENHNSLEELVLPASILEEFEEALRSSTEILPESARTFQEWRVGLLGRYERDPICGMEQQPLANKPGPMPDWPEGVEQVPRIEDMDGHEELFA